MEAFPWGIWFAFMKPVSGADPTGEGIPTPFMLIGGPTMGALGDPVGGTIDAPMPIGESVPPIGGDKGGPMLCGGGIVPIGGGSGPEGGIILAAVGGPDPMNGGCMPNGGGIGGLVGGPQLWREPAVGGGLAPIGHAMAELRYFKLAWKGKQRLIHP